MFTVVFSLCGLAYPVPDFLEKNDYDSLTHPLTPTRPKTPTGFITNAVLATCNETSILNTGIAPRRSSPSRQWTTRAEGLSLPIKGETVKISKTVKMGRPDLEGIRELHRLEIQKAIAENRDPPTESDIIRYIIREGLQSIRRKTTNTT